MSKTISKHHTRRKEYFPYEIVISCQKVDSVIQVRDTTLTLCKAYRIPPEKITIFLTEAGKGQEKNFREYLLPGTYGRLVSNSTGGLETLFLPGTRVVCLGSCLTGFWELGSAGKQPLSSLLGLIKLGFWECEKAGASLWGIQDRESGKRKTGVTTGLKRIPAVFWGCILGPLEITCHGVSDVERSILYYQEHGAVVRLGAYGVTCCLSRGLESSEIQRIARIYPKYARIKRTASGEKLQLISSSTD